MFASRRRDRCREGALSPHCLKSTRRRLISQGLMGRGPCYPAGNARIQCPTNHQATPFALGRAPTAQMILFLLHPRRTAPVVLGTISPIPAHFGVGWCHRTPLPGPRGPKDLVCPCFSRTGPGARVRAPAAGRPSAARSRGRDTWWPKPGESALATTRGRQLPSIAPRRTRRRVRASARRCRRGFHSTSRACACATRRRSSIPFAGRASWQGFPARSVSPGEIPQAVEAERSVPRRHHQNPRFVPPHPPSRNAGVRRASPRARAKPRARAWLHVARAAITDERTGTTHDQYGAGPPVPRNRHSHRPSVRVGSRPWRHALTTGERDDGAEKRKNGRPARLIHRGPAARATARPAAGLAAGLPFALRDRYGVAERGRHPPARRARGPAGTPTRTSSDHARAWAGTHAQRKCRELTTGRPGRRKWNGSARNGRARVNAELSRGPGSRRRWITARTRRAEAGDHGQSNRGIAGADSEEPRARPGSGGFSGGTPRRRRGEGRAMREALDDLRLGEREARDRRAECRTDRLPAHPAGGAVELSRIEQDRAPGL